VDGPRWWPLVAHAARFTARACSTRSAQPARAAWCGAHRCVDDSKATRSLPHPSSVVPLRGATTNLDVVAGKRGLTDEAVRVAAADDIEGGNID
jgi:hypothetical protein